MYFTSSFMLLMRILWRMAFIILSLLSLRLTTLSFLLTLALRFSSYLTIAYSRNRIIRRIISAFLLVFLLKRLIIILFFTHLLILPFLYSRKIKIFNSIKWLCQIYSCNASSKLFKLALNIFITSVYIMNIRNFASSVCPKSRNNKSRPTTQICCRNRRS